MENFSKEFIAFANEVSFAKEILGIGITQIRKANYESIGKYYQSFVCITTGLERLGKLCILLNQFLNDTTSSLSLKTDFSHNLIKLYKQVLTIQTEQKICNKYSMPPNEIFDRLLKILTDFACKDRYSNLDFLNGHVTKNLVEIWYNEIDLYIYENLISEKQKQKIEFNANMMELMANGNVDVLFVGEDNKLINDVKNASLRMGIFDAVAPKRQFILLQIVRFFCHILCELGSLVQQKTKVDVPYFSEIVGCFLCSDDYFKSRKCWDNI